MLISKLISGTAKPLTRLEEVLPMGPRSVTDGGPPCLSLALYRWWWVAVPQPRCPLEGSAPWVASSPSAVDHCALVWSYCLVRVSGNVNGYLPY
jgi:hypothetical protein